MTKINGLEILNRYFDGDVESLRLRIMQLSAKQALLYADMDKERPGFAQDMFSEQKIRPINIRLDAAKELLAVLN